MHPRGKNADNDGWEKGISESNPKKSIKYWLNNDTRTAVYLLDLDMEKT